LLHHGIGLSTASDTELIAHALCQQPTEEKDSSSPNWVARLLNTVTTVSTKMSYSYSSNKCNDFCAVVVPLMKCRTVQNAN